MTDEIKNIVKSLNKELGDFIQPLDTLEEVSAIPTGLPTLDAITGIGGIPRGRITEIYGNQSGGKSSLCLSIMAEAQKEDLRCAYIDLEFAMTKELASMNGVDLEKTIYVRPTTGEEAFQTMEKLLDNDVKLIVVDSVSAMLTEAEDDKEFGEQTIGLQARMMSAGLRKLIGMVKKRDASIIFVNQVREDINKFGHGPKTTTSGGRALRFYSSLRLEIARTAWITDSRKNKTGMIMQIKVNKNKVGVPQKVTSVQYSFDTGFDRGFDKMQHLINTGVLRVMGRMYYNGDKEIGSKQKAIDFSINY